MPGHQEDKSEGVLLQKIVREDKMLQSPVLRDLELTATKMLRQKAAKNRVALADAAQQATNTIAQSRAKFYKG